MDRMQPPPNYYGNSYPPPNGEGVPPGGYKNPYVGGPEQGMGMPPREKQVPPKPTITKPCDSPDEYGQFAGLCDANIGKKCSVYCSFTDSAQWHDMVFKGTLEGFGPDHVNIYNESNNTYTIIMGIYLLYIEFYEKIIY